MNRKLQWTYVGNSNRAATDGIHDFNINLDYDREVTDRWRVTCRKIDSGVAGVASPFRIVAQTALLRDAEDIAQLHSDELIRFLDEGNEAASRDGDA